MSVRPNTPTRRGLRFLEGSFRRGWRTADEANDPTDGEWRERGGEGRRRVGGGGRPFQQESFAKNIKEKKKKKTCISSRFSGLQDANRYHILGCVLVTQIRTSLDDVRLPNKAGISESGSNKGDFSDDAVSKTLLCLRRNYLNRL